MIKIMKNRNILKQKMKNKEKREKKEHNNAK